MTQHIELYTAQWCPDCRRAKEFLDRHGIAYEVVDIESVPGAAERLVEETGKRGIPYLVVDGTWVRAYEPGGGPFPEERILQAVGHTAG